MPDLDARSATLVAGLLGALGAFSAGWIDRRARARHEHRVQQALAARETVTLARFVWSVLLLFDSSDDRSVRDEYALLEAIARLSSLAHEFDLLDKFYVSTVAIDAVDLTRSAADLILGVRPSSSGETSNDSVYSPPNDRHRDAILNRIRYEQYSIGVRMDRAMVRDRISPRPGTSALWWIAKKGFAALVVLLGIGWFTKGYSDAEAALAYLRDAWLWAIAIFLVFLLAAALSRYMWVFDRSGFNGWQQDPNDIDAWAEGPTPSTLRWSEYVHRWTRDR